MKNRRLHLVVASLLIALPGTRGSEAEKAPPSIHLELALVDGSTLVGIPDFEAIPVQSPYARITLPLERIRVIKINPDHETASFELQNGDLARGVLELRSLELETLSGRVSVDPQRIRTIRPFTPSSLPRTGETFVLRFRAIDQDNIRGETYRLKLNDGPVIPFDEKENASRDGTVTERDYELYELEFKDTRLRPEGENVLLLELVSQSPISFLGFRFLEFGTEAAPLWHLKGSRRDAATLKPKTQRQTNTMHYHPRLQRQEQPAGPLALRGLHYKKTGHGYCRIEIHF